MEMILGKESIAIMDDNYNEPMIINTFDLWTKDLFQDYTLRLRKVYLVKRKGIESPSIFKMIDIGGQKVGLLVSFHAVHVYYPLDNKVISKYFSLQAIPNNHSSNKFKDIECLGGLNKEDIKNVGFLIDKDDNIVQVCLPDDEIEAIYNYFKL